MLSIAKMILFLLTLFIWNVGGSDSVGSIYDDIFYCRNGENVIPSLYRVLVVSPEEEFEAKNLLQNATGRDQDSEFNQPKFIFYLYFCISYFCLE